MAWLVLHQLLLIAKSNKQNVLANFGVSFVSDNEGESLRSTLHNVLQRINSIPSPQNMKNGHQKLSEKIPKENHHWSVTVAHFLKHAFCHCSEITQT